MNTIQLTEDELLKLIELTAEHGKAIANGEVTGFPVGDAAELEMVRELHHKLLGAS
jgi:hypothetical protein